MKYTATLKKCLYQKQLATLSINLARMTRIPAWNNNKCGVNRINAKLSQEISWKDTNSISRWQ